MKKKKNKNERIKIRIKELSKISEILKLRYMRFFPEIVVLLSCKNNNNENFIFQKIESFPLKNILFNKKNNSIFFTSVWAQKGRLGYSQWKNSNKPYGTEANIDVRNGPDYLDWDEIQTTEEKMYGINNRNSGVNKIGIYEKRWNIFAAQENTYDASTDIRIEFINRINTYEWGFEILSDTISLFAIKVKDWDLLYFSSVSMEKTINEEDKEHVEWIQIEKTADSFKTLKVLKDSFKSQIPKQYQYASSDIHSYWDASNKDDDSKKIEDDFNLDDLVFNQKKEKPKQVGQINTTNLILDDD
jgi:hypothetical protein